jgi:hypothetical protein
MYLFSGCLLITVQTVVIVYMVANVPARYMCFILTGFIQMAKSGIFRVIE